MREFCQQEESCTLTDFDFDVPSDRLTDAVINDPFTQLPQVVTTSFRSATHDWTQLEDEEGVARSPFREQNFDMLQRAVSREVPIARCIHENTSCILSPNLTLPTAVALHLKTGFDAIHLRTSLRMQASLVTLSELNNRMDQAANAEWLRGKMEVWRHKQIVLSS